MIIIKNIKQFGITTIKKKGKKKYKKKIKNKNTY